MNTRRQQSTKVVCTLMTVILLLTGTLAGARGGEAVVHAAGTTPIYVGQIVPLTGAYAIQRVGNHSRGVVGAQLALDQINAHGGINGRPLKLVLADDRSTNSGGIAALIRLTRFAHVAAIIGPGQSAEILAMTPAIERAGIPMIIGGGAPRTTRIGNPWVFRTRPTYVYGARAQAEFAVHTLHLARIALFHDNTVVGKEIGGLQRADLRALGISPVAELPYPILARDLTAQVLALKKSGATGLISEATEPADYRLLARQMQQSGVHVSWVGDPIMALAAVMPGAELLHGTYSATDFLAAQSAEAKAFERALQATFHVEASFPEAFTFDGLHILARVMRKVGTNAQAIRRGILTTRGYRGAMGTYAFDRNGDGLHQYTVVRNVDGRLHVIRVLAF